MKPLDEITARMFPTLAKCERQMRRRILSTTILSILAVYVLGRDLLSAYQGRVATQNMLATVTRINALEEKCQRDYPKRLVMTKAQAADSAWKREQEGRP